MSGAPRADPHGRAQSLASARISVNTTPSASASTLETRLPLLSYTSSQSESPPRQVNAFRLARVFLHQARAEQEVELSKQLLTQHNLYSPDTLFRDIRGCNTGYITPRELMAFLKRHDVEILECDSCVLLRDLCTRARHALAGSSVVSSLAVGTNSCERCTVGSPCDTCGIGVPGLSDMGFRVVLECPSPFEGDIPSPDEVPAKQQFDLRASSERHVPFDTTATALTYSALTPSPGTVQGRGTAQSSSNENRQSSPYESRLAAFHKDVHSAVASADSMDGGLRWHDMLQKAPVGSLLANLFKTILSVERNIYVLKQILYESEPESSSASTGSSVEAVSTVSLHRAFHMVDRHSKGYINRADLSAFLRSHGVILTDAQLSSLMIRYRRALHSLDNTRLGQLPAVDADASGDHLVSIADCISYRAFVQQLMVLPGQAPTAGPIPFTPLPVQMKSGDRFAVSSEMTSPAGAALCLTSAPARDQVTPVTASVTPLTDDTRTLAHSSESKHVDSFFSTPTRARFDASAAQWSTAAELKAQDAVEYTTRLQRQALQHAAEAAVAAADSLRNSPRPQIVPSSASHLSKAQAESKEVKNASSQSSTPQRHRWVSDADWKAFVQWRASHDSTPKQKQPQTPSPLVKQTAFALSKPNHKAATLGTASPAPAIPAAPRRSMAEEDNANISVTPLAARRAATPLTAPRKKLDDKSPDRLAPATTARSWRAPMTHSIPQFLADPWKGVAPIGLGDTLRRLPGPPVSPTAVAEWQLMQQRGGHKASALTPVRMREEEEAKRHDTASRAVANWLKARVEEDRQVEKMRHMLAIDPSFNLTDAFRLLDSREVGSFDARDLHTFQSRAGAAMGMDLCVLCLRQYRESHPDDGKDLSASHAAGTRVNFSAFVKLLLPRESFLARQLSRRRSVGVQRRAKSFLVSPPRSTNSTHGSDSLPDFAMRLSKLFTLIGSIEHRRHTESPYVDISQMDSTLENSAEVTWMELLRSVLSNESRIGPDSIQALLDRCGVGVTEEESCDLCRGLHLRT